MYRSAVVLFRQLRRSRAITFSLMRWPRLVAQSGPPDFRQARATSGHKNVALHRPRRPCVQCRAK
jgi:hypothetical protein